MSTNDDKIIGLNQVHRQKRQRSLTPAEKFFDDLVSNLSELPSGRRIEVISASCTDEDYADLLARAAYMVGPKAIDIVTDVIAQASRPDPEPV